MTPVGFAHVPVLERRCLDLLEPAIAADGAVMVDATLGLGGHTEAALIRFLRFASLAWTAIPMH